MVKSEFLKAEIVGRQQKISQKAAKLFSITVHCPIFQQIKMELLFNLKLMLYSAACTTDTQIKVTILKPKKVCSEFLI